LVEHFDYFNRIALGEIKSKLYTPEKYLERTQDSLWNYKPMPKHFDHPALQKGELEALRYANLKEAKKAFFEGYDLVKAFYKENPTGTLPNPVFGDLSRYEMNLIERKHFNHHFEQFGLV